MTEIISLWFDSEKVCPKAYRCPKKNVIIIRKGRTESQSHIHPDKKTD